MKTVIHNGAFKSPSPPFPKGEFGVCFSKEGMGEGKNTPPTPLKRGVYGDLPSWEEIKEWVSYQVGYLMMDTCNPHPYLLSLKVQGRKVFESCHFCENGNSKSIENTGFPPTRE